MGYVCCMPSRNQQNHALLSSHPLTLPAPALRCLTSRLWRRSVSQDIHPTHGVSDINEYVSSSPLSAPRIPVHSAHRTAPVPLRCDRRCELWRSPSCRCPRWPLGRAVLLHPRPPPSTGCGSPRTARVQGRRPRGSRSWSCCPSTSGGLLRTTKYMGTIGDIQRGPFLTSPEHESCSVLPNSSVKELSRPRARECESLSFCEALSDGRCPTVAPLGRARCWKRGQGIETKSTGTPRSST